MNEQTIHHGTAQCGHVGQIFKTGKCASCYIAELEAMVEEAKKGCDRISGTLEPRVENRLPETDCQIHGKLGSTDGKCPRCSSPHD